MMVMLDDGSVQGEHTWLVVTCILLLSISFDWFLESGDSHDQYHHRVLPPGHMSLNHLDHMTKTPIIFQNSFVVILRVCAHTCAHHQ